MLTENYREAQNSFLLDLKLPCGAKIELFSFPTPPNRLTNPEALGLRHLAFTVDSVDSYRDYLISKGVSVEDIRINPSTNKKFTFFKDPDGLPLELCEV